MVKLMIAAVLVCLLAAPVYAKITGQEIAWLMDTADEDATAIMAAQACVASAANADLRAYCVSLVETAEIKGTRELQLDAVLAALSAAVGEYVPSVKLTSELRKLLDLAAAASPEFDAAFIDFMMKLDQKELAQAMKFKVSEGVKPLADSVVAAMEGEVATLGPLVCQVTTCNTK